MDLDNHYEQAVWNYLRAHGVDCAPCAEGYRRALEGERVKTPDLLCFGAETAWLLEIKGRRYRATGRSRRRQLDPWAPRSDVVSLAHWAEALGPGYRALLVFAFHVLGAPHTDSNLWTYREQSYLIYGIPVEVYRAAMRVRSPRWDTVSVPTAMFRRLARPLVEWLCVPAGVP
ncbi:MAG: hypothetical protein C4297_14870 [Gemmataceae bacterium]